MRWVVCEQSLLEGRARVWVKGEESSLPLFGGLLCTTPPSCLCRFITSSCLLDYDTVAAADKFGNVCVLRLPSDVSAKVEDDPTGGKVGARPSQAPASATPANRPAPPHTQAFQGSSSSATSMAPFKVEAECNFHIGDIVTSLQRATLQPGGTEVLLYATIGGALGALFPLGYKEDVDFFQHLEMHLRQEAPPLLGRDHMGFRSYYFPVRHVVDGDLCELYPSLRREFQESIAEGLDRTPGEVMKKLEDLRVKVL